MHQAQFDLLKVLEHQIHSRRTASSEQTKRAPSVATTLKRALQHQQIGSTAQIILHVEAHKPF